MSTPPKTGNIRFHELKKHAALRNRRLLKRFILIIFRSEKKVLERLDVVFCTDQYLLQKNRQYLGHNSYTDVITFDLSQRAGKIAAEIYISSPRIKENSVIYNTSREDETSRVLFHGILHLCGYGDKSFREKMVMRLKENQYLKRYHHFVSRETGST